MLEISVVICTHNRASRLKETLTSVLEQDLDRRQYEIILVDNNSTDNTSEVFHHFRRQYPDHFLHYAHEPRLGLAIARNTGLHLAKGELIAYIDDDAVAHRDWLRQICQTFATVTPRPGAVGGHVEPLWETPPPPWLPKSLHGLLSITPTAHPAGFLVEPQNIIGANMAFVTALLRKTGGFPTHLGRTGNNLLGNEEILVLHNIRQQGYGVYFHPKIRVGHFVPAARLRFSWQVRRFFWEGVSNARLGHTSPWDELALFAVGLGRAAFLALCLKRKRAVENLLLAMIRAGTIIDTLQAAWCRRR